ncbi:hypothetical protein VTN49DRAFT_3566 [Thermomyces lanuginosus]|uniref:uncharacterized protein n=1 Tax=Thermomyces lanuginosus TaxID=5541 RepID=UPI003742427C
MSGYCSFSLRFISRRTSRISSRVTSSMASVVRVILLGLGEFWLIHSVSLRLKTRQVHCIWPAGEFDFHGPGKSS